MIHYYIVCILLLTSQLHASDMQEAPKKITIQSGKRYAFLSDTSMLPQLTKQPITLPQHKSQDKPITINSTQIAYFQPAASNYVWVYDPHAKINSPYKHLGTLLLKEGLHDIYEETDTAPKNNNLRTLPVTVYTYHHIYQNK